MQVVELMHKVQLAITAEQS
jgi:hypothetical protein